MADLTATERDCLERYCRRLAERRGRASSTPACSAPLRAGTCGVRARRCTRTSTSSSSRPKPIAAAEQEDLLNETYALYLECGRQLSPHFLSEARLAAPDDERTREFLERIAGETLVAWPPR